MGSDCGSTKDGSGASTRRNGKDEVAIKVWCSSNSAVLSLQPHTKLGPAKNNNPPSPRTQTCAFSTHSPAFFKCQTRSPGLPLPRPASASISISVSVSVSTKALHPADPTAHAHHRAHAQYGLAAQVPACCA